MYFTTLSKHPHVNSNQLLIIIYKTHCMIQSRSMTCANLSRLTMSSLVNPMARDNLHANIIAHEMNLIIMILFLLCYVLWTSLIRLKI